MVHRCAMVEILKNFALATSNFKAIGFNANVQDNKRKLIITVRTIDILNFFIKCRIVA